MRETQIIRQGTVANLPPFFSLVDMILNRVQFNVPEVEPKLYETLKCKRCAGKFPKEKMTQTGECKSYVLCPRCITETASKRARRKKNETESRG